MRRARQMLDNTIERFSNKGLRKLLNQSMFQTLLIGFIDDGYILEAMSDENVFNRNPIVYKRNIDRIRNEIDHQTVNTAGNP